MRPWIYLFKASCAAGIKFRVKTTLCKSFEPAVKLKMLLPAVKGAALFPCLIYDFSHAPVSASQSCFKDAYIVIVV